MKQLILFGGLLICLFSCKQEQKNEVTISGKVSREAVHEVTFSLLTDNLTNTDKNKYSATLDSLSQFSIAIPIKQLTEARIILGNTYHEMCFLPGDNLQIEVGQETISYKGKGAGKDNFLFASEVKWFKDSMSKILSNGNVELKDFPDSAKVFIKSQIALLNKFDKEEKLEPEFKEFYLLRYDHSYSGLLFDYSRTYAIKNKIALNALELPAEYLKMRQFKNVINDEMLSLDGYRSLIMNLFYEKRNKILRADSTLKRIDIDQTLLFDSLTGKTRDYIATRYLVTLLSANQFDSIFYNKFQETVKDSTYNKAVKISFDKYKLRSEIIGKPLNLEFTETMIEDTSNMQISFGKMMEKYKGKVVFLDLWGLNCGPCRANMPYSHQLKEQFKGQPVEFVYIAQDPPAKDVWEKIFKVTMTDQNQYRMVDHQWGSARMLKFLDISFVPCYMIFDKEGKLVDYNAEQPMMKNAKGELVIGNRLKKLAEL